MKKLILGILVLMSLAGCERVQNPLVGNWSYTLFGMVTYTFNADSSCSVTAPDFTRGGTNTLKGTYIFTQPDSNVPPQLDIRWEAATTTGSLGGANDASNLEPDDERTFNQS